MSRNYSDARFSEKDILASNDFMDEIVYPFCSRSGIYVEIDQFLAISKNDFARIPLMLIRSSACCIKSKYRVFRCHHFFWEICFPPKQTPSERMRTEFTTNPQSKRCYPRRILTTGGKLVPHVELKVLFLSLLLLS